jgi:hypothetical protein
MLAYVPAGLAATAPGAKPHEAAVTSTADASSPKAGSSAVPVRMNSMGLLAWRVDRGADVD